MLMVVLAQLGISGAFGCGLLTVEMAVFAFLYTRYARRTLRRGDIFGAELRAGVLSVWRFEQRWQVPLEDIVSVHTSDNNLVVEVSDGRVLRAGEDWHFRILRLKAALEEQIALRDAASLDQVN
jgi:hypothetical protein